MVSKQLKVLIVEDEAIVSQDLKFTLEHYGYIVTGVAVSGEEAIEHVRRNPPDLVLMDIRIQGSLNGMETAVIIESQVQKPICFIFLTALSEREFPRLKPAQSYLYLNKPFTDNELITSIQQAIAQC